ncbi:MAG: NAD+ synthase [Theionarchaea archaeon]|nr:NAD+ synthase [Theionarchaea archaeon]
MHIAVAQMNVSVGDLEGNAQRIITSVRTFEKKADIVVFPELTTTGYPPLDLLFEREFLEKNKEMLLEIAKNCAIPCIVGFVDVVNGKLCNAAALLCKGILGVQYKMLLPNYDVFDERRYFTPGKSQSLFEVCGKKVGIEICEDLWDHNYDVKPTATLQKMGADIIVNISASPYCVDKIQERLELAKTHIKGTNCAFVYCNLVGGQDELVFDGSSFVMKGDTLIKVGKSFEEDFFIVDLEKEYAKVNLHMSKTEELFKALVLGLKDYCRKTHFEKVVLGLSGGIDSSLVACIAVEAVGKENVVGVFMPSLYTSQESTEDAAALSENLGIALHTLPIDDIFDSYNQTLTPAFAGFERDTTEENIQARIRGNLLMAFSNKFGYLVLATGNKTEVALGYCTLYGDMSGGLSVIGDVSKMQVYELARYYNGIRGKEVIPERVFERPPSAELKETQVDPFNYAVVSPLVDLIIEERTSKEDLLNMGYDLHLIDDIFKRIHKNEYKRKQAAPAIKVTKKAFGIGRRYPIANQFTV